MEAHEILAPALQKYYSALKSLYDFGQQGDFFDDVSNLDKSLWSHIIRNSLLIWIPDQSIVLVKKYEGEDCSDGEVYIIEYEGNVMCKRFKKLNRGANFVADNQDKSYIKINAKQIGNCRIQGHVIELIKT